MKRYKVLFFDFDSRPTLLKQEIEDAWEETVKNLHKTNKQQMIQGLIEQFGVLRKNLKITNFTELGDKPVSIVAYHNRFLQQIRDAFVIGAYYPALTAACTLGERILNHLIIALRKDFSKTPEYKKVYANKSFDNWDVPITTLVKWGVLLPDVVSDFKKLNGIRNKVIHFDPSIDTNDRQLALDAIKLLNKIVGNQFSAFGPQPWFITDVPGEIYIKKEYEGAPFIKRVYLPNCHLLGPNHKIEFDGKQFVVHDEDKYEDREISDSEYVELRNSSVKRQQTK
jgi:hypothetical protein